VIPILIGLASAKARLTRKGPAKDAPAISAPEAVKNERLDNELRDISFPPLLVSQGPFGRLHRPAIERSFFLLNEISCLDARGM
jgi:hypothetical protein